MSVRLATGVWVAAYLARLRQASIPVYVVAKGDATAGAVAIKIVLGGRMAKAMVRGFDLASGKGLWRVLAEGSETEVDAILQRERGRDPDLWLIDVEDQKGLGLLDEIGPNGG